jgi:hypothetical protein
MTEHRRIGVVRFLVLGTLTVLLAPFAGAEPAPRAPTEPAPNKSPVEIPSGSFDLRPKFRMGQDRRVKLHLESRESRPDLLAETDEHAKKPGTAKNESEMDTKQEFVLVFRPVKVAEETSEVDVVFESIKSHVEGPGVDETFDSAKPAPAKDAKNPKPASTNDPLSALDALAKPPSLEETLRPMVGEKITLTVDRDGNIIDVKRGQMLVRALNPMAPEAMMQVGGDTPLRELFRLIVGTPGKPYAKPGESWSSGTTMNVFPIGDTSLRTDYRLSDVRGDTGKIAFAGDLKPRDEPSPGAGGLKLGKAAYSGSTVWDQKDGFPRSMQSKQELRAELKLGQQTVPLNQSQKVTLERLPDTSSEKPRK